MVVNFSDERVQVLERVKLFLLAFGSRFRLGLGRHWFRRGASLHNVTIL